MSKLEQAARQALDMMEFVVKYPRAATNDAALRETITALREALAEQAEQEPVACSHTNQSVTHYSNETWTQQCEACGQVIKSGTYINDNGAITEEKEMSKIKGPTYYVRHPNETYSVADPQPVEPVNADAFAEVGKPIAEQEPVAWRTIATSCLGHGKVPSDWRDGNPPQDVVTYVNEHSDWSIEYAYAAPVRTKDLTDDEIHKLVKQVRFDGMTDRTFQFARAVIAAYKEKNK